MGGDEGGEGRDMELLRALNELSPGQFAAAVDSINRSIRFARERSGISDPCANENLTLKTG